MYSNIGHLSRTRDIQDFNFAGGASSGYWWPKAWGVLQVAWLPAEEIVGPQPGMKAHRWNGQREIWVKEEEKFLDLWRPGFSLSLDFDNSKAVAKISRENDWQSVLRVIYFFGFLKERGLLLHASSLVHREQAYIFPGESGAGKTTIVRLSPELPLLTDEISAVQMTENGRVVCHGTPFFGDLGQPGEKLSVPVKGLYFPVKAQENRVIPLTLQETATRLISCICVYTTRVELLRNMFTLGLQLAERLPGYVLYFRQEPDFWKVIR
jgi:hypothetical protein